VNKNFNQDVSNAVMDLTGDDNEEMRRNLQKTKWDRKKKKFVSVQSTLDKSKKFKTESGAYINASYKSNIYSKWLKNSKAGERYEDQDNENGAEDKKNKKYFGAGKKKFHV
jgi:ATP-dependent RNA helicase DDX54/DBP10